VKAKDQAMPLSICVEEVLVLCGKGTLYNRRGWLAC